jgi:hypothetical protein
MKKQDKWLLVGAIFAPTICAALWALNAPATKAVSLVDKATNTTKMLADYEWFHESSTAFNARVTQILSHKAIMAKETDKDELRRLRIELAGMQQSCRDTAAKYEAKSHEIHVGYLKGRNLPETLNARSCE